MFAFDCVDSEADDVDVDGVGEDGDEWFVGCGGAGGDAGIVIAEAGSGEWGFGGLE